MKQCVFVSLCAYARVAWEENGKKKDVSMPGALHRLTHRVPLQRVPSLACARESEARRGRESSHHKSWIIRLWSEKKVLKLERKYELIRKKKHNMTKISSLWKYESCLVSESHPSCCWRGRFHRDVLWTLNLRGWWCGIRITACSNSWLWRFVLLQSDSCVSLSSAALVVQYPLWTH